MRTAIITGATGNLGAAVVKRFLSDGYRVAGTGRSAASRTDSQFQAYNVDLSDSSAAAGFASQVIQDFSHPDVAVLTVGGFAMGTISDTASADLRKQLTVNVETAWNVARPLFLQMLAQGYGRIFLIGSVAGEDVTKGGSSIAYALSKSLLFEIARILNYEAGHKNVVCSVIVPSIIDTPQNREAMPDADFKGWVSPEEIANVIAWYASPEADSIRNPVIHVTGN